MALKKKKRLPNSINMENSYQDVKVLHTDFKIRS